MKLRAENKVAMKKIAFVIPYLSGGGAERVTAVLASQISRMDAYEVHMVSYSRDLQRDYPISESVQWHCLDRKVSNGHMVFGKLRFFRGTIECIQPDCVVSLGGAGVIALLSLSMIGLNVPLILSERNDPRNDPKRWHLRLLRRWAYGRCDGVVFQTHEALGYFPHKIRRKGTVICNPLIGELPERYTGIREKRIVSCCRLAPQKNLDLLIDAFCDLSGKFPDYVLHIYGEGQERCRLEKKIRSMEMETRIVLRGYSNDIYEEIRKASMFVSSSDYEGISNSMLEAIALGVPTVCTDCPAGGAREMIRHGINGLLVPTRDRAGLAQAMTAVLGDPLLAERIGCEGEKLRHAISPEVVALRWLDFVEQVEKSYEC